MDIFANIKKILIKRLILGIFLGGLLGYLYYYYVGCSSGTCPITANPWYSTLYGTLIGGLLFYKKRSVDLPN